MSGAGTKWQTQLQHFPSRMEWKLLSISASDNLDGHTFPRQTIGQTAMVSPPLAMLIVVGLFSWMLFRPSATAPAKIFLLIVVVMIFGPVSVAVMNAEAATYPLKFDRHLFLIDRGLGLSAFWVARHLSEPVRGILFIVYETLGYWMIIWYGLNLAIEKGRPRQILVAYAVSYGLAPIFYLIVPACGPRHAFPALFPFGNPDVPSTLMPLSNWPNAIPSLHMATAVLLVYFSLENRWMRLFAWPYLLGTMAATLAFEHYVIDLVVGVPYACFAINLAEKRFGLAGYNLAVVLLWLAAIRFATPLLVLYPPLLMACALATVILTPASLAAPGRVAPADLAPYYRFGRGVAR